MSVVALVAVMIWLVLVLARGGFWRTDQRLPPSPAPDERPARWPSVTAVVPARDEADVLPDTLPTLLAQDYPGPFRVVLVDDASTDGTGEVARALAARDDATRDLTVVRGGGPPPGWAGKVAAMAVGVREAAGTDYLLFTDADIAHPVDGVRTLVRAAELDDRAMVSLMARLRTETAWERAIVPAFVFFFSQLYPFRWINRPGGRTFGAAGGCMLVRRGALEQAGGLARMRDALIDDVALGRLVKRGATGGRTWLGLTTDVVSARPYPRLADLWSMVARSAYVQLRRSPVLLAGTVVGLLLTYAAPPVCSLAGLGALAAGGGRSALVTAVGGWCAWALMAGVYVPMLRLYGLRAWRAPLLPGVAMLYAGMTLDSARRHWQGRGAAWKGRTAEDLARP